MFNFLSMIAGALIAIMTSFNGILSTYTGNYTSSVLIHFVGLIGIILVLIINKSKLIYDKNISIFLYVCFSMLFKHLITYFSTLNTGTTIETL